MDISIVEGVIADLFENAFSMIILFDKRGFITKWNRIAASQLGYEEEPANVNIMDIFRREFIMTEDGIVYSAGEDMNKFAYRKNQTCFPVELKVTVTEKCGYFTGICMALNTSQRVEAIKNIEKAKEETDFALQIRNEFVSNVTHELRTPVNGIKGIANALHETPLSKEQKDLLLIIERCCDNMSNIINDLLDFSKLKAGKFSLEEREFQFRKFLDRAVEASLPAINEKGLTLRVSITPDIPEYVIGDELRLTQIINNLLSNSAKFTNAGQITIEAAKTDEDEENIELFFMVMDTGIGIAKEDMDKLFKSFSQVDATITRKFGGTGMGLSITKQLVELMNGRVFVDSEFGKGSTFSFTVRLKKAGRTENSRQPEDDNYIYDELQKKPLSSLSPDDTIRGVLAEEERDPYGMSRIFTFGSRENKREIRRSMEKLILCIEMDNWDKAEKFAKAVKSLVGEEAKDLNRSVFRLELAIRREAKEKAKGLYEDLEELLSKRLNG